MEKLLLIGLDKDYTRLIGDSIRNQLQFECDIIYTYREIKTRIADVRTKYFLIILDLEIRNETGDDVMSEVLNLNVPVIIISRQFTDNLRDSVLTKNIIDFLIKEDESVALIDQLLVIIGRVYKNQKIKILIVDDSIVSRTIIREVLSIQKFIVLESAESDEVLSMLESDPEIKLVIIDYNMPVLNGFELTSLIRLKHPKKEMAIVGISAYGSNIISTQFLKMGANDFILKPFSKAEFCFRVLQTIEMLEYIDIITKSASIDFLTGLNNRRYFFEVGEKIFANAKRENIEIIIAMIDVDGFKSVNDTYGHAAGDNIIRHIASILVTHFRKADIIARFGGDEFCIIAVNLRKENAGWKFEELRKSIEDSRVPVQNGILTVTVSIGVTTKLENSLEQSMKSSDSLLYQAKKMGRNRVCID